MIYLILFIIFLIILFYYALENLNQFDTFIDYYVIHLQKSLDRKQNIELMKQVLNQEIKVYNAIDASIVDIQSINEFDKNIIFNFNYTYPGEWGCYLSHLLLIKSLLNTPFNYTVIFEDDFYITNSNLNWDIIEILNKITDNYDIIFLTNLNDNHGNNYKDNIYYVDAQSELWGTHGYLINNKNINKIYNCLLTIDKPIDIQYKYLIDNKILDGFVVYPTLLTSNNSNSTIH